jgi:hypothetical protein
MKIFAILAKVFTRKTEEQRRDEFLSQAVSRYHLEQLEKEYFGY